MVDRIGVARYRTWFGEVAQLRLHDRGLDVRVSNRFVGNWIASNYMDDLVASAREVLGEDDNVEVRIVQGSSADRPDASDLPRAATASAVTPARPRPVRRNATGRHPLRGRLEEFVVGPSNQLAYAAAEQVATRPGDAYKLLVVHGGCGLGKTHLLQGVCNALSARHPALEWRYISGEQFTNEYIYAVKSGHIDLFRARSRNVDVLVIDDIHFIANKRATQEEFLHTFNAIDSCGKAIVLSSDRHPRSMGLSSEPLADRLISGMVVEIDPPDFALRRQILARRAARMGQPLENDVLDYVAEHVGRNVRELEGALYKLVAMASLNGGAISLGLAREALRDHVVRTQHTPGVDDIVELVARRFGVTPEQIHGRGRDRTVALARAVALFLIRRHTALSYPEIGRAVGNKNHSTVLMATQRVERLVAGDATVVWKTRDGRHEALLRGLLEQLERELVCP